MRLIDADKLKKELKVNGLGYQYYMLDNAPTVKAIPIEWLENKRDELEKEYYDLFHSGTDEGRIKQVWVLDDFNSFKEVLRYWEKENG